MMYHCSIPYLYGNRQGNAMATMSVRSTYALDPETAGLIRKLAATWEVSQAEVIRRSVKIAASREAAQPSPAEVLAHYRTHPAPRSREETEQLIAALRKARRDDDMARTRWHG
jgi:hypothetical protein